MLDSSVLLRERWPEQYSLGGAVLTIWLDGGPGGVIVVVDIHLQIVPVLECYELRAQLSSLLFAYSDLSQVNAVVFGLSFIGHHHQTSHYLSVCTRFEHRGNLL